MTAHTADDELLDAYAIADLMGVNVRTVWKYMNDGRIRTKQLGRRRVARRAWIDQFIDDDTPDL